MNRLTEKVNNYYFSKGKIESDHNDEINKLGKLEDIEEKFGIGLITLLKALKDGVYIRQKNEIVKGFIMNIENYPLDRKGRFDVVIGIRLCYNWREDIDLYDEEYIFHPEKHQLANRIYTHNYIMAYGQFNLKDYGVTWALTKEELEK